MNLKLVITHCGKTMAQILESERFNIFVINTVHIALNQKHRNKSASKLSSLEQL